MANDSRLRNRCRRSARPISPTGPARCRWPIIPTIVMGHGGGGKLGNELVEHLFLPAFRNPALENLGDAAVLRSRLAAAWP